MSIFKLIKSLFSRKNDYSSKSDNLDEVVNLIDKNSVESKQKNKEEAENDKKMKVIIKQINEIKSNKDTNLKKCTLKF